jgi:uncharacterized protein
VTDGAPDETVELSDNTAQSRFEIALNGVRVGLADYYVIAATPSDIVAIPHTETSPAYGGRGLASTLVRYALDEIAASGRRVRPACPFVATYIQRHPEYAPLVG